jgi:hypothetical protein
MALQARGQVLPAGLRGNVQLEISSFDSTFENDWGKRGASSLYRGMLRGDPHGERYEEKPDSIGIPQVGS